MTTGTVTTQGTELFFSESVTNSDPTLRKMACPTGVTGVGGGAKDQVETTCLDTIGDKEYSPGLGSTSPISVPFNFISGNAGHRALQELKRLGTVIPWLLCLSDGAAVPVLDSDGVPTPPSGRTSVSFLGYVSEANIDVAGNEIVRGTLTIQRSGSETWHWLGPIPAGVPDPAEA